MLSFARLRPCIASPPHLVYLDRKSRPSAIRRLPACPWAMDQRPADDDGAEPERRPPPRRHPHPLGSFQRSTDTVSMSMDFPTDSSTFSLVPPLVSDMGAAMGLFDGARNANDRSSLRASNAKNKGDGGAHADGSSLRSRLWKRVASMRPKRRRPSERASIDQELYVRSILESYSSSMSSNRYSSSVFGEAAAVRSPSPGASADSDSELTVVCADGGCAPSGDAAYLAQLQTPNMAGDADVTAVGGKGNARPHRKASHKRSRARSGAERGDGDSEDAGDEEKNQRRLQRRLKIEAMRAKLLEKNQHRARTRKKIFIFAMWILVTLTAFMTAGVLIARTGVQIQVNGLREEHTEAMAASSSSTSASGVQDSSSEEISATTLYTYMHCVLMSLSLWMSLVVVGMHITFRSFRTYSHPFVLELSCVQCGYWIISLLRVQFETGTMSNAVYLLFCMAECFFNFGQISFTCAIAFNMYRSVVSYADVLLDSQSAKQRYRSYTLNVMLLSLLAAVTLALVGYKTGDDSSSDESLADLDNMQPCLYPTCRLILYVYYPLLAFGFNFIFYVRFKRTIGTAYPVSATGRLNKVALSYLVVFFICWGSLIISTALTVASSSGVPEVVFFVLQCVFDVLGMCTAVITFTNFHRCRKAFDFGLSLKAIDPNSIEFDDPVNIVGEGTFAIVLKARWRQGAVDNSFARSVEVAVKTFKHTQLECLDQIKEEAYLSSRLVHPCVMMTYGCYTSGINLYIVYEYLGGGTLQDILDASSSLPYATALRYAHMIAMGMRFLHGLPVPIVHRSVAIILGVPRAPLFANAM